MNKVIIINLNGVAYQLEESGYDALREYLENAGRQLEGNPDKGEIITDIEQAIADKFRALLGPYKTVVTTPEVKNVMVEMGPVQDASAPADSSPPGAATPPPDEPWESAIPKAAGAAEEFIRRAKAGYYEGMKTFNDPQAHRQWKRKFKQEMRGWKKDFKWQMREQGHSWKRHWRHGWASTGPHLVGALVLLPFAGLARWVLGLVFFFAVVSFLMTNAVFGLLLPFGLHGLIGLVFLLVLYSLLVWPFKALRHAYFARGPCGTACFFPGFCLWNPLFCAAFLILAIWLANRHIPAVHEALENLPPAVHHAANEVRQWWSRR